MNTNVVQLTQTATFEDFWKVCARWEKKALARAKFEAITSERGLHTKTLDRDSGQYVDIHLKATAEELIEGMKRYRKKVFQEQTPERFILHPASWLNQGRWED